MTDPITVATIFVGLVLSLAGGIWLTMAVRDSDHFGTFVAVFIWIVGVTFLVSGGMLL